MDIEGSVYASSELLSLRYPLCSSPTSSPCSSALLLSSPWPISPTSSSLSSSPQSSLTTINENTLLSLSVSSPTSLSSCSPPSSVPIETSPELGLACTTPTAVIFTTSSSSRSSSTLAGVSSSSPPSTTALTLGDPVSSPGEHAAMEVAHAPGKSILCVHEQDHGDVIHFSTSDGQLNHVNGNGNGNTRRSRGENGSTPGTRSSTNLSSVMEAALAAANTDKDLQCTTTLGLHNTIHTHNSNNTLLSSPSTSCSSSSNTDGNLFPTLILTSAPSSNSGTGGGDVIPMRLYASLTSVPTSSATVINANGHATSSILTSGDNNANLSSTTCILMTPHHHHHHGGDDDLHQLVTSSSSHHHHHLHHSGILNDDENNNSGASTGFTFSGFGGNDHDISTNEEERDKHSGSSSLMNGATLGTILMEGCCYDGGKPHNDLTLTKLTSSVDCDFSSSHGKLKDILMNGNSHHQSLLSSSSTNGDNYLLRDLESSYNNSRNGGGGGNSSNDLINVQVHPRGHSDDGSFVISKEDELEELKLHSGEQSSFNEAINSIYHSSGSHHHHSGGAFCATDENGDLIMVTTTDAHDLDSVYSSGVITSSSMGSSSVSIAPLSSSTVLSWSTQDDTGDVGLQSHSLDDSFMVKSEEGILGLDDDELLDPKEEREDDEDDGDMNDGSGVKGELKCKFCGFVCCSKSSLGIHERRHTGERPFACKYCGRLFNSAQCCKHHERLHTGDKPFQCSYCGKKYAVSTRLKRHERVHTREEPYKCTECNKTFRWFDAFRDHRNTHTGVPLYLCSVCGKTFTSYLKFYYHERGHLMKKERDRDRLIKQRQTNGGNVGVVKVVKPVPSHTIDIIKSLQQNSSACAISSSSLSTLSGGGLVGMNGNKRQQVGSSNKGPKKSKANSKKGIPFS
ncbi:unnamed protein product [Orchesella dallaii]|uniref:C2H2-type domain-containing protein n=1 Tax=Orchesella dallaii TaxID=48710 RepID=A0ABP1RBI2_9HEXA